VASKRGIEALVAAMSTHSAVANLQKHACLALKNVAEIAANKV
jgi:hypothetical protein